MISNKNKLLVGDVITGLAIAALFTMVAPEVAAQGFNEAVNKAQNNVAEPFARAVSYISYVMGAVMMVAGISDLRKHAQGTGDPPLNKGLGKTGAGAAFLAAPFVAGMLLKTGETTVGGQQSNFTAITF